MRHPTRTRRIAATVSIGLLAIGCAARLLFLDSDPHYYGWWGHLYDEGRWVQQARSLALRGVWIEGAPSPNLLVAPVFELTSYLTFLAAGVNRIAARLFPALSGCALLWVLFAFLRRRASPTGLALGLGLVALQADAVVLSRVAVPEMPAMLASLAAFAVLTARPPSPRRLATAGLLTGAIVALKSTTLPFAGILAVVVFGLREGVGIRGRWADLGRFAAIVAPLGLVALAVGSWLLASAGRQAGAPGHWLDGLRTFFGVNQSYAILAKPFENAMAPVINPACLALWAAALVWLAAPPSNDELRRPLRAALVWAVLYIGVLSIQVYFPERYVVHLFVPLALLAALACTRLEEVGSAGLARGIAAAGRSRRWVLIGTLCLPTAVLLAPVPVALLGALGAPEARLSPRLATLAVVWLAVAVAAAPCAGRAPAVRFLMAFPLVGAALWSLAWATAETPPAFWIASQPVRSVALRLGELGLLALAAGGLALAPGRSRSAPEWSALALCSIWSLGWAIQLAPGFLAPRYTVRDASRELGVRLAGEEVVLQHRAEGLFLDNSLAYRWIWTPRWFDADAPSWKRMGIEYLVTELPFQGDPDALKRRYELVRTFDLHAPATRWPPPHPSPDCPRATGSCVGLFRRRPLVGARPPE